MIIGKNKDLVIENIKKSINEGKFNEKVEVDDPTLSSNQKSEIIKKYLLKRNSFKYKFNNKISEAIISSVGELQTKDTKIVGLENIQEIDTGAIITSNHFNPLDNMAIRKLAKKVGKQKLYIVGQETNLAMTGFIGFMMNYSDIIPISDQVSYMKSDFQKIIKETLDKKNFILIYPEQEMWFNYRKPRTLKPGAYYYASKYKVPVISCFVEIVDKPEKDNDEFYKVKYIVHVLKPIYPDNDKSDKENSMWMLERDYSQKVEAYEKAYGKKLDYTFEPTDIAGMKCKDEV